MELHYKFMVPPANSTHDFWNLEFPKWRKLMKWGSKVAWKFHCTVVNGVHVRRLISYFNIKAFKWELCCTILVSSDPETWKETCCSIYQKGIAGFWNRSGPFEEISRDGYCLPLVLAVVGTKFGYHFFIVVAYFLKVNMDGPREVSWCFFPDFSRQIDVVPYHMKVQIWDLVRTFGSTTDYSIHWSVLRIVQSGFAHTNLKTSSSNS